MSDPSIKASVARDEVQLMWPHLEEAEVERRCHLANSLIGTDNERHDSAARAVMSLHDLLVYDGDELNLYANSPEWPFAGGASYWSLKLCDMKDIDAAGRWLEGEAAELRTERQRFEVMIESGDRNLWEIMAANPGCPGDLIDRMVRVDEVNYDSEQVRFCAAHNPATPPSTLAWLIDRDYTPAEESESEDDDPSSEVLMTALENPATPIEVLHRWSQFQGDGPLALQSGWEERASVARNWSLPVEIMQDLAQDDVPHVRSAVAGNPCCPVELLEALSLDADERGFVPRAVMENPSSSERARAQAALVKP